MKKWFPKLILRALALALAAVLVIALLPYARNRIAATLPREKMVRASTLLSRKVENTGDLTVLRCTDTGIMSAETTALFLGAVQQVNVPYSYEIGFGLTLEEVAFSPEEDSIQVILPPLRMIYDSFLVTGDPKISDFWYPLTEERYQQMLNEQAAACQADYLQNEQMMQDAWDAACQTLENLFSQWIGDDVPFRFVAQADSAAN